MSLEAMLMGRGVVKGTVNTHDVFEDNSALATYNLDGDALDLGGNYNGTWAGTEQYISGVFNDQAYFNESGGINLGAAFLPNVFSVSLWCQPIKTDQSILVSQYGGTNPGRFLLWLYSNGASVFFDGDYLFTGHTVSSSTRYHIAVTRSSDYVWRLFINGVEVDQAIGSSATIENTMTWIGGGGLSGSQDYQGSIDQVRMFNRALTAEEVDALYNETL